MDNRIEHKGIVIYLQMGIEPIFVAGRGWIHLARIAKDNVTRKDINKFSDLALWGVKVSAVDYAAGYEVRKDIGLVLSKKFW